MIENEKKTARYSQLGFRAVIVYEPTQLGTRAVSILRKARELFQTVLTDVVSAVGCNIDEAVAKDTCRLIFPQNDVRVLNKNFQRVLFLNI